eukprot:CAMPEP_0184275820 /NCGR_PEP_ID=MMETSP0977-20130417/48303_1 /TAXON_ID=483370 /ORGANISM="non described non described, Strain CCMP2097" /LENGTH=482 /DNA_ID=CAMNT_0026581717 /DNA_START=8 /DNA_END=1456 /DNA_ORIENTATION=-
MAFGTLCLFAQLALLAHGLQHGAQHRWRTPRTQLRAQRVVSFEVSVGVPRRATEPMAPSPVSMPRGAEFVSDDEIVLASAAVECGADSCAAAPSRAYVRAGPRATVALGDGSSAAIMTCGGLCPGLNTVVQEVARALEAQYGVRRIYGVQGGFRGLAAGRLEPLVVSPSLYSSGGTVLGTSRGAADAGEMADVLESFGIDAVFIVGGDGTIRGASALCAELSRRKSKVCVAVVPKTIDNDIPLIDRSFGFDTAVAAAKKAVDCAVVEARSFPRGVAVVRLMGRGAGFLATHAALAAPGDVDVVLVPEQGFALQGTGGLLEYVKKTLDRRGNACIVVAEGVGARIGGEAEDVGLWLCAQLKDHFQDDPVSIKYVDPTYMVRALPSDAADTILCARLAANAVHGAGAGFTDFAVATINTHYAYVPLGEFANRKNLIAVSGRLWADVVRSTGQPTFGETDDAFEDAQCDDAGETPAGGCVVSYDA